MSTRSAGKFWLETIRFLTAAMFVSPSKLSSMTSRNILGGGFDVVYRKCLKEAETVVSIISL